MTNDTRTADDIERDIQEERARMSSSINNLQQKFSVDGIIGDLGDMLRNQGGDFGRAVTHTVGRNPAAVVMVGVGLAWLFLGRDRNASMSDDADAWDERSDRRSRRGNRDSWDRAGLTGQGRAGEPDPYWYGDHQMGRTRNTDGRGYAGGGADAGAGNGIAGALQGAASTVSDAVSNAASSVGQAASDLTSRLSHGLDDLSEEARNRVVAARRAAYDARQASGAAVKKGARAATNFFDDQPLVVGALAVAVGAAMGGILPHTRIEDETMGASSDKLFADAQALYQQERDKAMAAMRTAVSDVKEEVRGAGSELAQLLPEGKTAGDVIVDRASEAAARVYGHATGAVEHDPSGNPRD